MFRSTSLRLAALYTGAFALSVVMLGVIIFFATRNALAEQFETRIRAESAALVQEFQIEGLEGVVSAVRERDRTPGALVYGLRGPRGENLAGRLGNAPAPTGWAIVREPDLEEVRVLTVRLADGHVLLVGDDETQIEALDGAVVHGFGWSLLWVVILGAGGGIAMSAAVGRRLAAISDTAEAIIDGDMTRRVPARGTQDDLDRLALTINRMLDRIASLMESLRQVSSDIAHDMRSPLTRLRHRLEQGLADPAASAAALEGALGDLDAILETFAALLRIAQIEGGTRRSSFRGCDLTIVARTVVDAFAPSAEDQQQTLALDADRPVLVDGDSELLTQMLVNLVENALRHAGPGARVKVRVKGQAGKASVAVLDNGPGVP